MLKTEKLDETRTDAGTASPARAPRQSSASAVVTGAGLAGLLVLLFAQVMVNGLHRDEYGYIVSGVLMREFALYGDFGYNHMPYLPVIYSLSDRLFHFTHLHLAGRCLAFLFVAGVTLLVYAVAHRFSKNRWVALGLATLFVANPLTVDTVGRVVKDYPAIAFTLLGYSFLTRASGPGALAFFGAGLCLAIATGFKLYYVLFALPVAVLSLRRWRDRGPEVLSFALGLGLGAAPLIGLFLQFPEAFWFNNVDYHLLNKAWYAQTAEPEPVRVAEKLAFFGARLMREPALAVLAIGILLAAMMARVFPALSGRPPASRLVSAGLLVAVGAAFLPSPSFIHHYLVLVPFGLIAFAGCFGALAPARQGTLQVALLVMLLTTVAQTHVRLVGALGQLPDPSRWTPMQVHEQALDLAALLPSGSPARVATLAPLLPIEAGLPIYPELTTGIFFYRVGDMVPPERRTQHHLTSFRSVRDLLRADPPAAVLTGFEPALERPFVAFGLSQGYQPIKLKSGSMSLLVRQPAERPSF